MSKNYRFRTEVGVDKEVRLQIEQDFDFLEVLSLKLRQEDIYNRFCADYGVVAGRVVSNGGFGIPNVNVSVFVPLDNIDEDDPIISTLYPYKTVSQKNEDGYRYNLLPYKKEYGGHNPTGTFPDREDVLTRKEVLYIYEKYYKYTVKTNNSGDFMIVGVPLGTQQIVFDLDLSNIGEFSLRPADLIRMGIGTEAQFDGPNFKASENLDNLPQIINSVKQVEVNSFWGQEDLCDVGISRIDLDLRDLGVEIIPHCVFMGSIVTTSDDDYIKRRCKPKRNTGELCSLITGPGVILSIRQTIDIDFSGNPILEEYKLENGGNVIDENGVWMTEIPMNLDYVTTNEFGEQIISNDPDIGIPTNSKYRFKIKYAEKGQDIDRANYLVPNIKEHGWSTTISPPSDADRNKSYAFSLDWSDYYDVNAAINCEDTFYKFRYNRVYTIASHIDRFKSGSNRKRELGIKEINDRDCQSDNNRFPVNEAVRNNNVLIFLFNFILSLLSFVIIPLFVIVHALSVVWAVLSFIYSIIAWIVNTILSALCLIPLLGIECPDPVPIFGGSNPFRHIPLPMLSYPDCDTCECEPPGEVSSEGNEEFTEYLNNLYEAVIPPLSSTQLYSPELLTSTCAGILSSAQFPQTDIDTQVKLVCSGWDSSTYDGTYDNGGILETDEGSLDNADDIPDKITWYKSPVYPRFRLPASGGKRFDFLVAENYTWAQGLNLMNRRFSYFDLSGANNTGTSVIQTTTANDEFGPSNSTPWMDSCFMMLIKPEQDYEAGKIFTFNNPNNQYGAIEDLNLENQIEGSTGNFNENGYVQKSVRYVRPDNGAEDFGVAQIVNTQETTEYKHSCGVEYFQVLTAMTISEIGGYNIDTNSILAKYVLNYEQDYECFRNQSIFIPGAPVIDGEIKPKDYIVDFQEYKIAFCVRGVDMYTARQKMKYDLSKLFGYQGFTEDIVVEGEFRMNIPIQPNIEGNNANTQNWWRNGQATPAPHFRLTSSSPLNVYSDTDNISNVNFDKSALYHKPFAFEIDPNEWTPFETFAFNTYVSLDKQNNGVLPGISVPSSGLINPSGQQSIEGCGYQTSEVDYGNNAMERLVIDEWDVMTVSPGYFGPELFEILPNLNRPKVTMSDSEKIVFRSDRIPLSDVSDELTYTSNPSLNETYRCDFRQYGLHLNTKLRFYGVTDEGEFIDEAPQQSIPGPDDESGNGTDIGEEIYSGFTSVIETFSCEEMVPLGCYSGDGTNFGVEDPCDFSAVGEFLGVDAERRMKNGCYVFVTGVPLASLPIDFYFLREYIERLKINFALCQGVIGESFQNNWINGTLYMPAFQKTSLYYTDPDDENFNKLERYRYCGEPQSDSTKVRYQGPLYFNTDTNSFYYRSTPYDDNNDMFIGQTPIEDIIGANDKNIWFPTTIMELGPRDEYAKELSLSGEFEGYIIDKIPSTSYKENSAITQLFVLSRIASTSFVDLLITYFTAGVATSRSGIGSFFTRNPSLSGPTLDGRVDGDYAQMVSINSEFGVVPYIDGNYPDSVSVVPGAFGIFFDSNTNDRRILTDGVSSFTDSPIGPTDTFGYANTQEVPFYMWGVNEMDTNLLDEIFEILEDFETPPADYLFGSESSNWNTQDIYSVKYQDDNFYTGSNQTYMMPNVGYGLGYIYNRSSLNPEVENETIPNVTNNGRNFKVGGPFFFYFGLKRGKSAINRFRKKYLFIDLND